MIRVDSDGLRRASEEMEQQIRFVNQAISEVEDISTSLNRLSSMYDIVHYLRKEAEKMETERANLMQMVTAIREVAEVYDICENKIVAYAEELTSRNVQNFTWIDLPVYPGTVNTVISQINWN